MKSFLIKFVFFIFLAASFSAFSHHGASAYDQTKPVTITGVIKEVQWQNPHVQIYIEDSTKEGEKAAIWVLEAPSPRVLEQQDWTSHSLKTGDKVAAVANARRNGQTGGWMTQITILVTGKTLTSKGPAADIFQRPPSDEEVPATSGKNAS